jgi:WD40 repeat protein/serine/threonine protein kinase
MAVQLPTRLEDVVVRFEAAWAEATDPPPIESYLPPPGSADRPVILLELLLIDLERRQTRGLAADAEDYLAAFPELAARSDLAFTLKQNAERLAQRPATAAEAECPSQATAPLPGGVSARLPAVPGYAVLEEIARGGMGRVLVARDLALGREVAVKIPLPGLAADEAAVERFLRESRITAKLPHPGIPPVHALGTLPDGSPFLAMKLIRGRTLDVLLAERPSPTADLPRYVQVFEQVCQAVGFAHRRGVIHRDLKPQNVMVGEFGEVQVMDWGLAKEQASPSFEPAHRERERPVGGGAADLEPGLRTPRTEDTRQGTVLGTIAYIPPEQARGEVGSTGPRSDVFALGGILCTILTGRPPYDGIASRELLALAVAGNTADALARLVACGADPELIALCRLCLKATPADRPADGGEVAELVAAYRAGVETRLHEAEAAAAAAAARLVEQRKKRRWQVAVVGFVVLAAILGASTGVALSLLRETENQRAKADNARAGEEKARLQVENHLGAEVQLRGQLQSANTKLVDALKSEQSALTKVDHARKQLRMQKYGRSVQLAYQEYRNNNIAAARAILDDAPEDLRGWEWKYVHRLCHSEWLSYGKHKNPHYRPDVSRDGTRVVTSDVMGTARVWDVKTGETLAVFPVDGGKAKMAAFSPSGRWVVTGMEDGTVRIWNAHTGTERLKLPRADAEVTDVRFSPGADLVVSAYDNGTARVWDARAEKDPVPLTGHTGIVTATRFSPDGDRVATACWDGTARIWDAKTGTEALPAPIRSDWNDTFLSIAYTPDGKWLVTGSRYGQVNFWNARTGEPGLILQAHTDGVGTVALSSDGSRLLTGGWDYTAKVWDAQTGRLHHTLRGLAGNSLSAAFVGESSLVVTAGNDVAVRVWDLEQQHELVAIDGRTAAFSPDGRRVALAGTSGGVRLIPEGSLLKLMAARVSRAGLDGVVRVIPDGGGAVGKLSGYSAAVNRLAFAGDGSFVVTAGEDKTARVWDVASGAERQCLSGHEGAVISVAVSPDGRLVATASDDGPVRLFDAASGEVRRTLPSTGGRFRSVAFDPDGKQLVTAEADGTARLWHRDIGEPIRALRGHSGPVYAADFSRDGKLIVTAGQDRTARVWDAGTGTLLAPLEGHTDAVLAVGFSPDGKRVVTGGRDRSVRLWDADTGTPLLTLREHREEVTTAAFTRDGTRLVTSDAYYRATRVWDSRPVPKYGDE